MGLILGILTGYWDNNSLNQAVNIVSEAFMNLFKLISIPIIFFSILSSILEMNTVQEFKNIGKKLIKYTLLTTYAATIVALLLYLLLGPAHTLTTTTSLLSEDLLGKNYLDYFVQIIPSNLVSPFSENNVMNVLFLGGLFGTASLGLPARQRAILHDLFSSFHSLFIKIASWVIYLIPIAIWSFMALLIKNFQENLNIKHIVLYLTTIIMANIIQGVFILPLFIKSKGIYPIKLAYSMLPALSLAFFSKSSSTALPMTLYCAEERVKIPKKIANIAFPLCTAINMNGCAAFILITVLFVSMSHGINYSISEMVLWTVISTIAAIGNAGVPMGCYFLSSALLAAMNIPLNLLATILPFYVILDMLETSINVWSDSCVVAVVEQEIREEDVCMPVVQGKLYKVEENS